MAACTDSSAPSPAGLPAAPSGSASAVAAFEPTAQIQAAATSNGVVGHTAMVDLAELSRVPLASAQIVLQAPWGAGAGEVGRNQEASRPGPQSLAVDAGGRIHLLDQVNGRICRFSADGQLDGIIPQVAETTEDIALAGNNIWTVVYERLPTPGYRLDRLDASGVAQSQTLGRWIQLFTGLFVSGPQAHPELWVEQRHNKQTRVVQRNQPLPPEGQRLQQLGRPARFDKEARLLARRLDSHQAVVIGVQPGAGTSKLLQVETPLPIRAITFLDSDAQGRVFLGLFLARESGAPKFATLQEEHVLLVQAVRTAAGFGSAGVQDSPTAPASPLLLELAATQANDHFRTIAVGEDGALYQMQSTETQLLVRRWTDFSSRRPSQVQP